MSIIDLRNAIARQEDHTWDGSAVGWGASNPNSLAQKNNNPGNLRYNPDHPEYTPRAIGAGAGGFAKYTSVEDGAADLDRQIGIDAGRGLDIGAFINKYAPSNENNTNSYLSNVMKWLGISTSDVKLTDIIGGTPVNSPSADSVEANIFGDPSQAGYTPSITLMLLLGLGALVIWKGISN